MKNTTLMLPVIILLGFLLRISLAFLPGFHIDVNDWFAWAIRLNQVGFEKFYSPNTFSDYTPGYMYVLGFLGFLRNLLHLNDQIFFLVLKLPAIIAEMILGLLIYRFSKVASMLIFLNPALIFNSAIWGQIDSILALFLFLTIYYLKNRLFILASILLGIAFLIKPQSIAIFPIFSLYLIKNFAFNTLIKSSIPFLLFIFFLSLPFFQTRPFTGLITLVFKTAGEYDYTSLFAYNFWGMIGFWINDNTIWSSLSYQQYGYILLASYWMIISYLYLKKKLSIYAVATLATLGFFFLPTRVHERYLYPALVFLILLSAITKSKLLLFLTAFLNLIHFLNLYYVYVYYNELYLNLPKVLYHSLLYNFLNDNGRLLSAISTVIFLVIIYVIKKLKA